MRFVGLWALLPTLFVRSRGDFIICGGKNATSIPVMEYCQQNNGTMELRCCFIDDMKSIIAVDLTDFNLTQIPDLPHYSNLIPNVLDIRSNEKIVPQENDFVGATNIVTLFLPPNYACPGGDRGWNIINTTTDPPGNLCSGLKNACLNASQSCREPHSYCSGNGPNHTLCLCESTYHGYKCLRNGQFPTTVFLGSTCAVAVVAAALLYWITRRHVRKHQD